VTLLTASPTPVSPPPEMGIDAEVEAAGAEEDAEVDVRATKEETPVTTSAPPTVELAEGDTVAESADDAEVVMTEGSAEIAGAELARELAAGEVIVVMIDGSPDTGAGLTPVSVDTVELSDSTAEVTVAESLIVSDIDEATLDSSRPVEEALAMDEVIDDGTAETVPLLAIPECEGLLHLPLPCPAA